MHCFALQYMYSSDNSVKKKKKIYILSSVLKFKFDTDFVSFLAGNTFWKKILRRQWTIRLNSVNKENLPVFTFLAVYAIQHFNSVCCDCISVSSPIITKPRQGIICTFWQCKEDIEEHLLQTHFLAVCIDGEENFICQSVCNIPLPPCPLATIHTLQIHFPHPEICSCLQLRNTYIYL